MNYLDLLARLHSVLLPRAYLEIGVETGLSLALSKTRSVAIDPDPYPSMAAMRSKPWVKLYATTSDEFFATHSVEATLEGYPLDLVFVDGLHAFAQVIRDIEHCERWSHDRTVMVVHDVIPSDSNQATRFSHLGPWTGDVWRIVPFLREVRPDLDCKLVESAPTGVLVITGLNPHAAAMSGIAMAMDATFPDDGPEYDGLVIEFLLNSPPLSANEVLRDLRAARQAGLEPVGEQIPGS